MVGLLYSKEFTCPLCNKQFKSKQVRRSKTIVEKMDSDFCPHYASEDNPLFYDPLICPKCGYAAMREYFDDVTREEKIQILKNITPNWNARNFGGSRDINAAIECYKQLYKSVKAMDKKTSIIAAACIRLAWCYRYNSNPREDQYLQLALRNYKKAYEEEKLPIKKLNAITLLYIIGDLYARLGNKTEALKHFSSVVEHPHRHNNKQIEKKARRQWRKIKDELSENGS